MQPKTIARVLEEVYQTTGDIDHVLAACTTFLQEQGRADQEPAVLRSLCKRLQYSNPSVTITVPEKTSMTKAKTKTLLASHNLSNRPATVRTQDIIGGYVLEYDHTTVDTSYRGALLRWYRQCTT